MKRVNLLLVLVLLSGTFVLFLPQISAEEKDTAILSTKFGDIVISFKDDVAPKTVANFKKLANSGFYDGTIFHRIIPGFVIQGGDPNTKSGSRDTWGIGDPGYKIAPEFSNLKHKKYIVSMARGADINSAGSQFFIMLGDAPSLDGQYTIFGEVISGKEVVDKIASLQTNSDNQPIDEKLARMNIGVQKQFLLQSKASQKNDIVYLVIKNPKDSSDDIYGIKLTNIDGKITKFIKIKNWTYTRLGSDSVMYQTTSSPLNSSDLIKIALKVDSKNTEIQWEAFSKDQTSLGTGKVKP